MKKLYYTVDKELQDIDGIEETTGHKTVNVYNLVEGEIVSLFELEMLNEDNSEDAIFHHLDARMNGEDIEPEDRINFGNINAKDIIFVNL